MRLPIVCAGMLLLGCGRIGFEHVQEQVNHGGPAAAGALSRGGTHSVGGTSSAGGTPTSGGAASTGGTPGASGTTSTGGTPSAGGTSGNGGTSGAGGTSVPSIVHCSELPFLVQPPELDGMVEAGLFIEPVVPVGWRSSTAPLPAGTSMRYAAAWRSDGLYFFLEVTDPDRNPAPTEDDVWKGDGVEIYVDHDGTYETPPPFYDLVGTRQFFVGAPPTDAAPGTRAEIRIPVGNYSSWAVPSWVSIPTDQGYAVEAFIDAEDLDLPALSLSAGQSVGFDLAHNVSVPPGKTGEDGNRLSQYFLRIKEPPEGTNYDYPFDNESVFCSPTLLSP